jgi:hypothetical protein
MTYFGFTPAFIRGTRQVLLECYYDGAAEDRTACGLAWAALHDRGYAVADYVDLVRLADAVAITLREYPGDLALVGEALAVARLVADAAGGLPCPN